MFKNKFFIFIILILALVSVDVASASDSSSMNAILVDESNENISEVSTSNLGSGAIDFNTGGEIKESSNTEKSFDDLQTEINNKSDNSVLDLASDYKYSGTTNFTGIIITKNNFTIDGHGYTLDANAGSNNVRIFNVSGTNVTLKNLILINANVIGDGAAIYNTGELFCVSNCTFMNNTAKKSTSAPINNEGCGGAIYNCGVNFTVSNNNFTNNTASYGGAIYNYDVNYFTVSNNIFINNKATRDYGG